MQQKSTKIKKTKKTTDKRQKEKRKKDKKTKRQKEKHTKRQTGVLKVNPGHLNSHGNNALQRDDLAKLFRLNSTLKLNLNLIFIEIINSRQGDAMMITFAIAWLV